MVNKGIAPPDPTSAVGQLRGNIGDVVWVALDPPETGFGDYNWFSDATLEILLATSDDSVARATGKALQQLALNAAMTGESIRTDDLAYDNRTRGESIMAIAKSWMEQADDEESYSALIQPGKVAPVPNVTPFGLHEDPANPGYYIP